MITDSVPMSWLEALDSSRQREVDELTERLGVLERRLEAHHAISATTEDVLSYHDPRRCPVCAEVEP